MTDNDSRESPRQRRRAEISKRIVTTAMAMVERGGLGSLSINQLAAELSYTPGALYRYVPSKDALVSLLVIEALREVRSELERAASGLPRRASPLMFILALIDGYRAFAAARPARFALLSVTLAEARVVLPADALAQPVASEMIAALQVVSDALERAVAAGQLSGGPVAPRVLSLFAVTHSLLQMKKQALRAPETIDVDQLIDYAVRSLLLGWGAAPRNLRRLS